MATLTEALALALQYHQAGNLQQAEYLYRQILQTDPRQADALHLLGLIAHQRGQHDAAIDLIRRALASNPGVAGYHANLGLVYLAANRPAEAAACFEQVVKLDPNSPVAHYQLGNLRVNQ